MAGLGVEGKLSPTTLDIPGTSASRANQMLREHFAMGTVGLMAGWPRRELAGRALTDGYLGGIVGVLIVFADLLLRYGG